MGSSVFERQSERKMMESSMNSCVDVLIDPSLNGDGLFRFEKRKSLRDRS